MEVSLVMVKSDGTSRDVVLDRPVTVIGRDETARVRIPMKSVSRKHCEVRIEEGQVVVADQGSSNGTYVNGKRTKHAELAPGDLLTVGPVVFVVKIDGHPRQIDVKDSFAAGTVLDDNDDSSMDLPSPPSAPTMLSKPPVPPPAAKGAPPPAKSPIGGKSLLDDDDDGESISDLLKDFDFGDEEDEPPKKK